MKLPFLKNLFRRHKGHGSKPKHYTGNWDTLTDEIGADVKQILGMYFDSREAFPTEAARIARMQKAGSKKMGKQSRTADTDFLIYSADAPWKGDFYYSATYKELKVRNARDGLNTQLVGCMVLIYLYHMWEDYREKAASYFKINDSRDIRVNCFGDIRNFRNAIIHNRRIATKEVSKNRLLQWFKQGDLIAPTAKQFQSLSKYLHNEFLGDLERAIVTANPRVKFAARSTALQASRNLSGRE